MLTTDNSVLVVVDVQGKLAQLMFDKDNLFANLQRMIKGAQLLGIPILWTEQYPEGLGVTIPELAQLMRDGAPLVKDTFSCCGDDKFAQALKSLGRKNIMLTGIETHVCVYQTARDLLADGYAVELIVDAVSSRTEANKNLGVERMKDLGAGVMSTEMTLFELLRVAKGDKFKEVLRIVK
ncbi:MAG: hydrolase [Candidatus Zixiibacteriota bacterium]